MLMLMLMIVATVTTSRSLLSQAYTPSRGVGIFRRCHRTWNRNRNARWRGTWMPPSPCPRGRLGSGTAPGTGTSAAGSDGGVIFEGAAVEAKSDNGPSDREGRDDEGVPDQRARLREDLKQYRLDQSSSLRKPAYTVFTNAALDGIVAAMPSNDDELLEVKGIGKKKLEMYGDDILDIVRRFAEGGLAPLEDRPAGSGPRAVPRPPPVTLESLTPEQREAARTALDSEASVFISGAAGTGKSHVSKYLVRALPERDRKCAPTAPTGVAAINVGGSTLHSFFGVGIGAGSVQSLVRRATKKKEVVRRIEETDVLLIDEVSMLSSDLLETIDAVARAVRTDGSDKPMGGMQIIAVGDFFQLPPILPRDSPRAFSGGDDRDDWRPFCFDSPVWSELGLHENTFELSQVQRQEGGSRFEMFLNMVRVGTVPPDVVRDFNRKCLISKAHPIPNDGIMPTRIYTHNRAVDSENESRLDELPGPLAVCAAMDEWRERMPPGTPASTKKSMKTSIAGELPDTVQLKVGAQVMLTRNKDLGKGVRGLVNGSRGTVESFDSDELPIVRFDNGRVERIARVEAVRYNPDGGPGALVRTQLPLKLAWATTVHKSQGSTLTRASLDLSRTFDAGQCYVALSRVGDIDGLFLERPLVMDNIKVSQRVLDYYRLSKR